RGEGDKPPAAQPLMTTLRTFFHLSAAARLCRYAGRGRNLTRRFSNPPLGPGRARRTVRRARDGGRPEGTPMLFDEEDRFEPEPEDEPGLLARHPCLVACLVALGCVIGVIVHAT